jgi:hypothetical protein
MDRNNPRDGRDDEMRDFPSEAEWLSLPAPDIRPDFVADTLALVRAEQEQHGVLPAGAAATEEIPPALLAAFAAPATSPAFVERTLQMVQRDRQGRLLALLARYVAPEPTPDFVQRTLRALLGDRRPVRRPWLRHGLRGLAVAAAAALLLFTLPWPQHRIGSVEEAVLRTQPAAFAAAWTPNPLGVLVDYGRAAREPDALPLGAPDGLLLLAATRVEVR